MLTDLRTRLQNTAARLRKNEEGVAAIEFAIIAPLLISMYFGLAEIAKAIAVDRQISHGTNVAGDLITQNAQMTAADIEEALSAAIRVMDVPNGTKVTIDMRSYVMDEDGEVTSEGIVQMNKSANTLPAFDTSELDDKILNENSGVVVTRVAYTYTPLKLRYFDTDITLSETFMLKPRRSDMVVLGPDSGKNLTCTATKYSDVSCSAA